MLHSRDRCSVVRGVFCLLLLGLLWVVAPAVRAGVVVAPQAISVDFNFDEPNLDTTGGYTHVTITGCDTWSHVGGPILPFRTVRILLPPGSSISAVEAIAEDTPRPIPGEWRIDYGRLPRRSPEQFPGVATMIAPDEPDWRIYLSDSLYPSASVELVSVQRLGGYAMAIVRVYPVQYAPLSGLLVFAPRIRVRAALLPQTMSEGSVLPPSHQERIRRQVSAMVNNPDMMAAYDSATMQSGPLPAVYDYLLLTKSNLVAAFQPLVAQKTAAGLSVKIETVENISASYDGRDVPEMIRNYIRYAYTNWGVTYVLLGGDTATVPVRYAYAYMSSLTTDYFVPCDLYYACLDGSWDKDGDGIFGEPTDGEAGQEVDLLAEVYVGRAPVDTVAEANIFVEKTVRYETQSHGRAGEVLLMAEYLGTSGGVVAQGWDMFVPFTNSFTGYHLSALNDAPFTTPQWTGADAINALNKSPNLAIFGGHGDPDSVMRLFTESLDALTNQWLSLTYSVSCDSGAFDNDDFWPDCVGEELTKRNAYGAFAAILNSRLGWYDAQNEWKWSGEFQIRFFDHVLSQGETRLGVANQLSKHDLVGKVETSGLMTYRYCCFEINLLGDPHVAWQALPKMSQLVVSSAHGEASPPIGTNAYATGSSLTCMVTNSPLSGGAGTQYVCTGWLGLGSVPASGNAIQTTFTLTGDALLTWTWKTQVWFAVNPNGSGSVNATNGWRDIGNQLSATANASVYHHFVRWMGDVPAGMESSATLNITLDRPRTVSAVFEANVTSLGTPEWWLASYGWTNQFEGACLADPDHDGMPTWKEYTAGTSPVDPASALVLRLEPSAGPGAGYTLRWPSVSGRWYSVYRADSPQGAFVQLTSGMAATPPMNSFTDGADGAPGRFYRVSVQQAP